MNKSCLNFVTNYVVVKGVGMKKSCLLLALILLLGNALVAEAHPHRYPRMHRAYYNMPPRFHYNMVHRHGCPIYRGRRCTCHRYYGGNGIYIDFRFPIMF